jgi:hypothetical protein
MKLKIGFLALLSKMMAIGFLAALFFIVPIAVSATQTNPMIYQTVQSAENNAMFLEGASTMTSVELAKLASMEALPFSMLNYLMITNGTAEISEASRTMVYAKNDVTVRNALVRTHPNYVNSAQNSATIFCLNPQGVAFIAYEISVGADYEKLRLRPVDDVLLIRTADIRNEVTYVIIGNTCFLVKTKDDASINHAPLVISNGLMEETTTTYHTEAHALLANVYNNDVETTTVTLLVILKSLPVNEGQLFSSNFINTSYENNSVFGRQSDVTNFVANTQWKTGLENKEVAYVTIGNSLIATEESVLKPTGTDANFVAFNLVQKRRASLTEISSVAMTSMNTEKVEYSTLLNA